MNEFNHLLVQDREGVWAMVVNAKPFRIGKGYSNFAPTLLAEALRVKNLTTGAVIKDRTPEKPWPDPFSVPVASPVMVPKFPMFSSRIGYEADNGFGLGTGKLYR
ncbi:hypothetical protein [Ralstonia phage phiRSL1]|uniref:Uncharacterized protein n=1 Tax=Ralstonia phage phiRSL1 TaxID=1980924 RepID=B2ZXN5_9CAUD|nr:hypothetical protein RSL1_ORF043 [Ralstonia phage phiRSL1]BAG41488.1 hypothetical protein [Ralstonia phage phiRSL1]